MITLNEIDFSNAIKDLYALFSPQNLSKVPAIIEKYKGSHESQRSAIQMAFLLYFNKNNPVYPSISHILPDVGTEKNILKIMESYSSGQRILSQEALEEIEKHQQNKQLSIQKEKQEIDKKTEEKLGEVDNLKKTIETLQKELDKSKSNQTEQKNVYNDVIIEIHSFIEPIEKDEAGKIKYGDFDYSEVVFPPIEFMSHLSIGQRMILPMGEDGNFVGVEVVNVIYDCYSEKNKIKKMIEFKKF